MWMYMNAFIFEGTAKNGTFQWLAIPFFFSFFFYSILTSQENLQTNKSSVVLLNWIRRLLVISLRWPLKKTLINAVFVFLWGSITKLSVYGGVCVCGCVSAFMLIPPLFLGFVRPGVPILSAAPGEPWEHDGRPFSPSSIWFILTSVAF